MAVFLLFVNKLECSPLSVTLLPSLIFEGKLGGKRLDLSLVRGSTLLSKACKCWTRVEVNDSGKHTSLLLYNKNTAVKSFIVRALVKII